MMRLKFRLLPLAVLWSLLSSCAISVYEQRASVAADRGLQFLEAIVVHENLGYAFDVMVPGLRPSPAQWPQIVGDLRGPSKPSRIRAVAFENLPGGNVLDVYFDGETADGTRHWRVRVVGDVDNGYRVAAFERIDAVPQSTTIVPFESGHRAARAATRAAPEGARVAFAPIDADPEIVAGLAEHYARELPLGTGVLAPLTPDAVAWDDSRQQLIAEELALHLRDRFRAELDAETTVIGVTSRDMYIRGMNWRFALSYRVPPRIAVVSYARMDPRALRQPSDPAVTRARLRKMTAKNIGILVYGLRATSDPRSLMFRDILGVDELDFMVEDYQRAGMQAR
jgi:predicted Zn-dependent protease